MIHKKDNGATYPSVDDAIQALGSASAVVKLLRDEIRSLWKWIRWLTLLGAVFLLVFVPWYIIATRNYQTANREAICNSANSMANSLIRVSPPNQTVEEQQAQQNRIDNFEEHLEATHAEIDCDIELIDAPPPVVVSEG